MAAFPALQKDILPVSAAKPMLLCQLVFCLWLTAATDSLPVSASPSEKQQQAKAHFKKGKQALKPGPEAKTDTPSSSAAPIVLYGQIDEFSYLCSSAGVRLDSGKLPAKVAKISIGSAASYSGVRPGDKVLDAKYDDNSVTFSIERDGKRYQAKIATNVKGLKEEFESRKIKFSFGDSPFDKELQKLRDVSVKILMDRSLSMGDINSGVPGDISKWMWCKQQIDNVFLATDRVLEEGFDIYLFNDRVDSRRDVTLWDLRRVFESVKPAGQRKDIGTPLRSILDDYFSRRTAKSKPCLVVLITDGVQNSGPPLQEVLIEASKQMNRQGEVVVLLLQVGESILAEELFEDLDRNLVAKGARFHMANFKTFSELRNRGVLYEMLSCMKDVRQAPAAKVEK